MSSVAAENVPTCVGKCSINIPDPEYELCKWDLELSPKSKLIANLTRLKQNSYEFNELRFRSGILSGMDHSWSITLKPECNYISTTLDLPDDTNSNFGIVENSTLELWHEKDGKKEMFLMLKIQFSKSTNAKRNSWTSVARLLDTSWNEKVVMIRFAFTLRVHMVVRASVMGYDLPPKLQSPHPLMNGGGDNSGLVIGMDLLNSGLLSDVILICEGTEIPAHRIILACRSPVFSAMFQQNEMKEAQEGRVVLEEIDLSTLKRMLEFVYTGQVTRANLLIAPNARDLHKIADRFGIMDLKSICSKILLQELAPENAAEIYALGNTHNDLPMMDAALHVLKYNRKKAFNAETLKDFCSAFPETMFKLFESW